MMPTCTLFLGFTVNHLNMHAHCCNMCTAASGMPLCGATARARRIATHRSSPALTRDLPYAWAFRSDKTSCPHVAPVIAQVSQAPTAAYAALWESPTAKLVATPVCSQQATPKFPTALLRPGDQRLKLWHGRGEIGKLQVLGHPMHPRHSTKRPRPGTAHAPHACTLCITQAYKQQLEPAQTGRVSSAMLFHGCYM